MIERLPSDRVVAINCGYLVRIPEHCYAVASEFAVVGLEAVAEKADLPTVGEVGEVDEVVEAGIAAAGHAEAGTAAVAALDIDVAAESGLGIVAAGYEADRAVGAALAADMVVAARHYLDGLPSVAVQAVSVQDTVAAEDVSADGTAALDIVADTAVGTAKQ